MVRSKAKYFIPDVDSWPAHLSSGSIRVRLSAMMLTLRDTDQDLVEIEAKLTELQDEVIRLWGRASIQTMMAIRDKRKALGQEQKKVEAIRARLREAMTKAEARL